jgi:hypothetical protein
VNAKRIVIPAFEPESRSKRQTLELPHEKRILLLRLHIGQQKKWNHLYRHNEQLALSISIKKIKKVLLQNMT